MDHGYGNISELKRAQLNTKLRSLEKSLGIIHEFQHIQREIEFFSGSMFAEDVNNGGSQHVLGSDLRVGHRFCRPTDSRGWGIVGA